MEELFGPYERRQGSRIPKTLFQYGQEQVMHWIHQEPMSYNKLALLNSLDIIDIPVEPGRHATNELGHMIADLFDKRKIYTNVVWTSSEDERLPAIEYKEVQSSQEAQKALVDARRREFLTKFLHSYGDLSVTFMYGGKEKYTFSPDIAFATFVGRIAKKRGERELLEIKEDGEIVQRDTLTNRTKTTGYWVQSYRPGKHFRGTHKSGDDVSWTLNIETRRENGKDLYDNCSLTLIQKREPAKKERIDERSMPAYLTRIAKDLLFPIHERTKMIAAHTLDMIDVWGDELYRKDGAVRKRLINETYWDLTKYIQELEVPEEDHLWLPLAQGMKDELKGKTTKNQSDIIRINGMQKASRHVLTDRAERVSRKRISSSHQTQPL